MARSPPARPVTDYHSVSWCPPAPVGARRPVAAMGARRRSLLVDILARLGGILAASFQLIGGLFKPVAPPAPSHRHRPHQRRRGRLTH